MLTHATPPRPRERVGPAVGLDMQEDREVEHAERQPGEPLGSEPFSTPGVRIRSRCARIIGPLLRLELSTRHLPRPDGTVNDRSS